jgi:hypothetical protein
MKTFERVSLFVGSLLFAWLPLSRRSRHRGARNLRQLGWGFGSSRRRGSPFCSTRRLAAHASSSISDCSISLARLHAFVRRRDQPPDAVRRDRRELLRVSLPSAVRAGSGRVCSVGLAAMAQFSRSFVHRSGNSVFAGRAARARCGAPESLAVLLAPATRA